MAAFEPLRSAELGEFRFRFAVLADTHINPRDGESPSPWLTNRHANARSRAVVEEINRYAPDFTVHLGDIVHPVPSQPTYAEAATQARDVLDALDAPLHCVPGNHDMGDKYIEWAPAAVVNEPFLDVYESHFGKDFFVFEHEGWRFFILNSQVFGSGLDREAEQWEWLEAELAKGGRTFLFSHYPPYVAEPGEMEHYDNMGEPARGRLLGLIDRHGVDAVFAGHVHNFFYDRRDDCDLYVLPAVSAVRHDYMELFATPPTDGDHGRDDGAKLGFFVVDVYERDHVAHFVRSHGSTAETGRKFRPVVTHTRLRHPSPVGIDMRHPWGRVVEVAYQGVVDEFYRKRARNDYLLAALWEIGVRTLRVPLGDLLDDDVRARMQVLAHLGHDFLVFTYGVPDTAVIESAAAHSELVGALEIIVSGAGLEASLPAIFDLRARLDVPVYVSKLRSSAEAKAEGGRYTHFISHGFGSADREVLSGPVASPDGLDGAVFRVDAGASIAAGVAAAAAWAEGAGLRAIVHVTLADENPAIRSADDRATANRVAEALFAGHAHADRCVIVLDTFADMDRGYFPRNGLVDRLYNPRLASNVFGSLQSVLSDLGPLDAIDGHHVEGFGSVIRTESHGSPLWLLLPDEGGDVAEVSFDEVGDPPRVIDLASGDEMSASWADGAGGGLRFDRDQASDSLGPMVAIGASPHG